MLSILKRYPCSIGEYNDRIKIIRRIIEIFMILKVSACRILFLYYPSSALKQFAKT
jgi:hypothetical protein